MSEACTYSGPGWYRVRLRQPGEPDGTTRAVYIKPLRDIPGSDKCHGFLGLWLSKQAHDAGEDEEASFRPETVAPFIVVRIGASLPS